MIILNDDGSTGIYEVVQSRTIIPSLRNRDLSFALETQVFMQKKIFRRGPSVFCYMNGGTCGKRRGPPFLVNFGKGHD